MSIANKPFEKIPSHVSHYTLVEAMFSGYITNQTHLFMSMGLIMSLAKLKQGRI